MKSWMEVDRWPNSLGAVEPLAAQASLPEVEAVEGSRPVAVVVADPVQCFDLATLLLS